MNSKQKDPSEKSFFAKFISNLLLVDKRNSNLLVILIALSVLSISLGLSSYSTAWHLRTEKLHSLGLSRIYIPMDNLEIRKKNRMMKEEVFKKYDYLDKVVIFSIFVSKVSNYLVAISLILHLILFALLLIMGYPKHTALIEKANKNHVYYELSEYQGWDERSWEIWRWKMLDTKIFFGLISIIILNTESASYTYSKSSAARTETIRELGELNTRPDLFYNPTIKEMQEFERYNKEYSTIMSREHALSDIFSDLYPIFLLFIFLIILYIFLRFFLLPILI